MNDEKMTLAQKKLYDILLNLFRNKDLSFPKNRTELKKNHEFFKILDEMLGSKSWYGLNIIKTKTMNLIKKENRKDLSNIIRTSVLDTLDGDCSLKKIEYEKSYDCLKSDKKTLYEYRYRTKKEVTIEKNLKADDIIKNAIKRLFINMLINDKSDTLFQSPGTYRLEVDNDIHYFPDEIDVEKFKKVIATFDDYIFKNQEIQNLIQTWAGELEKCIVDSKKTTSEAPGINVFELFRKSKKNKKKEKNDKNILSKKEAENSVLSKKNNGINDYIGFAKEAAIVNNKKTKESNKKTKDEKNSEFSDKNRVGEGKEKNLDKRSNGANIENIENNSGINGNEKKIDEMANVKDNNRKVEVERKVINNNNICDCLTNFKGIFNKCF